MTKIFKNSNLKPAFTLAEVLITLVIIGVIAAATIPTLLQKHFEQEMISKLKKNYSVLSNALMQAIRDNGNPDEWQTGSYQSFASSQTVYNYLKPYLKVQKECGSGTGCFASGYKALFSDTLFNPWRILDSNAAYYKFILEDGTAVAILSEGTGCSRQESSKSYSKICGSFIVDLNNKKGPNRLGIDRFSFRITEKSIMPTGTGERNLQHNSGNGYGCKYNDTNQYNGIYCGAHVIYKGNMDYLRHNIEDEWK